MVDELGRTKRTLRVALSQRSDARAHSDAMQERMVQAEGEASRLRQERDLLREALEAGITTIEELMPHVTAVASIAATRSYYTYEGPPGGLQSILDALRTALAAHEGNDV